MNLTREPVRKYLYSVLVAGVAILVWRGLIASEESFLWIALGAAVLGVPATEIARSKVTPVASPRYETDVVS